MAGWNRREIELVVELLESHPDSQSFRLSQAVSALLEEFDERESDIEDAQNDVDSLRASNNELYEQVEDLQDRLAASEESFANLCEEFATLEDSYDGVLDALAAVNVQE